MAVIIAAAVCCVLLYVLLAAPALRSKGKGRLMGQTYYAHRGLHGNGVSENSVAAFRLAMEQGYGIELDVRLTKDNRLVVFHDDTPERLCGDRRPVREMTLEEVHRLRLLDGQGIPLFEDVLALVQGKVPLLVEIKSHRMGEASVAEKTWEVLKSYRGPYAVQSFDPFQLRYFKNHAKDTVRGQLARACPKEDGFSIRKMAEILAGNLMFDRISVPDYVAYQHTDTKKLCYQMMRRVFRAPLAVWTVRSEAEEEKVRHICDMVIFENYLPGKNEEEEK